MLSMTENLLSFLNWLEVTMKEKDIVPADIARTGFVSDSAISLLLSGTTKRVSVDMCRAISQATEIPLITVYRIAGILPPVNLDQQEIDEIMEEANKLNHQDRAETISFMLMKQNIRKKK